MKPRHKHRKVGYFAGQLNYKIACVHIKTYLLKEAAFICRTKRFILLEQAVYREKRYSLRYKI